MTLKDRINQFLKDNKVKKTDFARMAGVSPSYISLLTKDKNAEHSVSKDLLQSIEAVLSGVQKAPQAKTVGIDKHDVGPLITHLASAGITTLTFSQFRTLCEADYHCTQGGINLSEILTNQQPKT